MISLTKGDNVMDKLLTQQDLAERWQVTVDTITNWRKEGVLQPVQGLPAIRFHPAYIAELEGTKLDKFSPLERRKMQRQIERLQEENEKLRKAVLTVLFITSKAANFITEKEDLYF